MATIVGAAGGGNWTTGATWVGGIAPTAADDAQLIVTSGNVTIDTGAVCRSLDCTGYIGVLTHNTGVTLNIGDGTAGASSIALKLVAGMTYTLNNNATSAMQFISTSTTQQTINYGGKTCGNQTFNGALGSWKLSSAIISTLSGNYTIDVTLTTGSLDTNGQAITCRHFISSGALTRSLTLGASTITTQTNGGGNSWEFSTTTNLTFNAGTSTVIQQSSDNSGFSGGGLTYNVVQIANSRCGVGGSNTYATLTCTGNGNNSAVSFSPGTTQTVTGTFTATGSAASGDARLWISGNNFNSGINFGTAATINAAVVSLSWVDFNDITAGGAASPWSGTSIGDMGGNTNITATTPVTRYWMAVSGGSANVTTSWSATDGGATGATVPLPQDTINFTNNSITSGGRTISWNMSRIGTNINFTGMLNSPTVDFSIPNNSIFIQGSLTLITGMALSGTTQFTFYGRTSSLSFTTAGLALTRPVSMKGQGGTYTQTGLINCGANAFEVENGNWDMNGSNITATSFSTTRNTTRSLTMRTGTFTVSGTGTVWNAGTNTTNLTITPNTSVIAVTDTSSTAKNLDRASNSSLYDVTLAGGTGIVSFRVANPGTIHSLTVTPPANVRFNVAATYNFTGVIAFNGTVANAIVVDTSSAGTAAIFNITGSATASYTSFKDINANPAASIWAGDGTNTNTSNNHNIIFAPPKRLGVSGVG